MMFNNFFNILFDIFHQRYPAPHHPVPPAFAFRIEPVRSTIPRAPAAR